MEPSGLHRGLELRLETLAARIRMLRDKVEKMEGVAKIEGHGQIVQLEERQKDLESRLKELKREGPSFRYGLKKELEKLSYDLSGALENFILRTDSRFQPGKRPLRASKSSK